MIGASRRRLLPRLHGRVSSQPEARRQWRASLQCGFMQWRWRPTMQPDSPVSWDRRNGNARLAKISVGDYCFSSGALVRGSGWLAFGASDAAAQSPAQILVPLTVPTNLHPIGACGFTWAGGLLAAGAVWANALAVKNSATIPISGFMVFPLSQREVWTFA